MQIIVVACTDWSFLAAPAGFLAGGVAVALGVYAFGKAFHE